MTSTVQAVPETARAHPLEPLSAAPAPRPKPAAPLLRRALAGGVGEHRAVYHPDRRVPARQSGPLQRGAPATSVLSAQARADLGVKCSRLLRVEQDVRPG
jgi:hypothetical protein